MSNSLISEYLSTYNFFYIIEFHLGRMLCHLVYNKPKGTS